MAEKLQVRKNKEIGNIMDAYQNINGVLVYIPKKTKKK
jgi:hypothetical protein